MRQLIYRYRHTVLFISALLPMLFAVVHPRVPPAGHAEPSHEMVQTSLASVKVS